MFPALKSQSFDHCLIPVKQQFLSSQLLIKLRCKLVLNGMVLSETRFARLRKSLFYLNFISSCVFSEMPEPDLSGLLTMVGR